MAFGDKPADLLIFRGGVVEPSVATAERVRLAGELRKRMLERDYVEPIYGMAMPSGANELSLMPDPDTVDDRFGGPDESIYDVMDRNVLIYPAVKGARKDVALSLPVTFLAGVKGDADSEVAREEVEDAYLGMVERDISVTRGLDALERGYQPLEVIFDELTFGKASGYVGPVQMIDHPRKRFKFDYRRRPYFIPSGKDANNPRRIDYFKVAYMRAGSLHTPYGVGYGPRAYPSVYAIDKLMKQNAAMAERFSYMPMIVQYPERWGTLRAAQEKAKLERLWKNVAMVPNPDIDVMSFSFSTEAAYANANATATARMAQVNMYVEWLSRDIQGSQYSSGTQQAGSFARDQVASSDRLYKAPSDAAMIEAFWNRGLIEPMMLVNRPTLERHKWPRCGIDASFGEDIEIFMRLCESGARMEIPISTVTWSERTKIPLAQNGEAVLAAPSAGAIADPNATPLASAEVRMSEPTIRVMRNDGSWSDYAPDQSVYVKGQGRIRAALLQNGSVIVADPKDFMRAV